HGRLAVNGVLNASLSGHGTIKSPSLQGNLSIPALHLGKAAITAISANAAVRGRLATLALAANFSGAPLRGNATVNLAGAYETKATFNSGRLKLGPLLTAYAPGTDGEVQCQTEVQASLRGPLKDWRRMQVDIEVPAFRVAYRTLQVTSAAPISLAYESGAIVLKPAELKGTGTDFHLQGTVPLGGSGAIRASASGTIDLHLLEILYPEWDSSGQIELKLEASGARSHPNVQGQARVINASIEPPYGPIGVHEMNASVKLAGNRAEITSLTAQAGGGSLSASGFMTYNRGLEFNLALQAHTVRIRYPAGAREVLDSNLRMTGAGQNILISGQVSLDRLSLTQSFDVASFTNQFNIVSAPAQTNSFASRVKLSIAVRSAHTLRLSSSQLNLSGTANLRLQGTLADPVIVGRATLSGGELFFNGARYRVVTGVIDFVNPAFTEPIVNVRVATTVDQYALTIGFTGPFDRLRTTYTSDPPLPPADIISLLLTGQAGQATGLGAQSLLAQGLTSQFSNRIQKLTGLSSLTIDPGMGNGGRATGARIAVQERVTRNLYFNFSVDVATTQDDIFQLEYNLSRKWSVEATRDQAGDYSLEVKAHRSF
ncbi:MAG: translocation/assembly module TamB domain-containing protein, partial [Terriglobia bacterium]